MVQCSIQIGGVEFRTSKSLDGVLVAVASGQMQMLDRELFRMVGIEPESMKITGFRPKEPRYGDLIMKSFLFGAGTGGFSDNQSLPTLRQDRSSTHETAVDPSRFGRPTAREEP